MTIEEASEKYCIPIKILKEYESMELCKTVKRVMGEWHYNDEDIKRLTSENYEIYITTSKMGKEGKLNRKAFYNDEDIKRLSMIMTLYETDFSKEDIDEYMQLILSGENDEECLKILSQKRKKALDKIHILEKQISNLDYLKNEIKNNN